jgi:hypothetical protein
MVGRRVVLQRAIARILRERQVRNHSCQRVAVQPQRGEFCELGQLDGERPGQGLLH